LTNTNAWGLLGKWVLSSICVFRAAHGLLGDLGATVRAVLPAPQALSRLGFNWLVLQYECSMAVNRRELKLSVNCIALILAEEVLPLRAHTHVRRWLSIVLGDFSHRRGVLLHLHFV
jgi:hypothetical protein